MRRRRGSDRGRTKSEISATSHSTSLLRILVILLVGDGSKPAIEWEEHVSFTVHSITYPVLPDRNMTTRVWVVPGQSTEGIRTTHA